MSSSKFEKFTLFKEQKDTHKHKKILYNDSNKIIIRDFLLLEESRMKEIKEGTHYKTFEIEGVRIDIYYGYESKEERHHWPPSPIYPNFAKQAQYTPDGTPFALAYQDICKHYLPIVTDTDFVECDNCRHFDRIEDLIGLCRCPQRRERQNE